MNNHSQVCIRAPPIFKDELLALPGPLLYESDYIFLDLISPIAS